MLIVFRMIIVLLAYSMLIIFIKTRSGAQIFFSIFTLFLMFGVLCALYICCDYKEWMLQMIMLSITTEALF